MVSAYIAAVLKARVALIESEKMGGDCLNTGCVPSKALLKTAKVRALLRKGETFGLKEAKAELDFPAVMARVREVIAKIAPHDSVERYTGLGVECFKGQAKLLSPFEVEVEGKTLSTKKIILATGARPSIPNIPGLRDIHYLTSETIWNIQTLPESLLVMGGGAVGCELGQAFARLGSKVTLIEQANHLLPAEDAEVSLEIEKALREEGIDLYLGSRVLSCSLAKDGATELTLTGKQVIKGTHLLLALGRSPRVDTVGAKELGIELNDHGFFALDPFLRTNYSNIYACGDLTGVQQLTHAAAHEAWYASVNALFAPFRSFRVDRRFVPQAVYVEPELARVGLNENEAKAKKVSYELTTYFIDDLDRAIADGEARGFVRVLTEPGKDKILGVTIVGQNAGDLIAEFVLAMKNKLGLRKILSSVHSYPTMAEANKYAAGNWAKSKAPKTALKLLERFHRLRRRFLIHFRQGRKVVFKQPIEICSTKVGI